MTLPPEKRSEAIDPQGIQGMLNRAHRIYREDIQGQHLVPASRSDMVPNIEIPEKTIKLSDMDIERLGLPEVKTPTLHLYRHKGTGEIGYILQSRHAAFLLSPDSPEVGTSQMQAASALTDAVIAQKPITTATAINLAMKEGGFSLNFAGNPVEILQFATKAMNALADLKAASLRAEKLDMALSTMHIIKANMGKNWLQLRFAPPHIRSALTYLSELTVVAVAQEMQLGSDPTVTAKQLVDMRTQFSKQQADILNMWANKTTETLIATSGNVGESLKALVMKVAQGGTGAAQEILRVVADSVLGQGSYDEGVIRSILAHAGVADDVIVDLAQKAGMAPAALLKGFYDTIRGNNGKSQSNAPADEV